MGYAITALNYATTSASQMQHFFNKNEKKDHKNLSFVRRNSLHQVTGISRLNG